jgi:hypothetical protein
MPVSVSAGISEISVSAEISSEILVDISVKTTFGRSLLRPNHANVCYEDKSTSTTSMYRVSLKSYILYVLPLGLAMHGT